jgi:hypothetical protein
MRAEIRWKKSTRKLLLHLLVLALGDWISSSLRFLFEYSLSSCLGLSRHRTLSFFLFESCVLCCVRGVLHSSPLFFYFWFRAFSRLFFWVGLLGVSKTKFQVFVLVVEGEREHGDPVN